MRPASATRPGPVVLICTAVSCMHARRYVAFFVSDGDSMGFSTSFHYKQIREATNPQWPASGGIRVASIVQQHWNRTLLAGHHQQPPQWQQQEPQREDCSCLVPIGWSFNPQLVELFPTLLQWHSRHSCGGRFELVGDWCDGTGLADTVDSTSERAVISFAASHRRNLAGM